LQILPRDAAQWLKSPFPEPVESKNMKLAQKTALVTGASQGIGLAIAQRLAREGARVMLADIRTEGADAAKLIGEQARFFCADVSQKADVDAMIAATLQEFGQIDILVNNAGVTHAADFLDLAEEDFDRVLRINLKSMFLCSQAAAREMVKRQSGCIINMSSVNAELTIPNQVPYVVSKGGVNQLTRVAAISLAQHGIRVNAIGPGTILTELAKRRCWAARRRATRSCRARRWAAAASPRKWRRSRPSSPATMPRTSPARRCTRMAAGWR
jgi:NAD(P)-dependent dehydrogenase (short-subunit alcohol dehydrogenase family)